MTPSLHRGAPHNGLILLCLIFCAVVTDSVPNFPLETPGHTRPSPLLEEPRPGEVGSPSPGLASPVFCTPSFPLP